MKQKDFVFNLCLLIFLNLLVKPFWMLGVDVGVQNSVGAANYGIYFSILNFTLLFNMVLDMGTTNFNNRNIARNNQLLDKHLSSYIILRLLLGVVYFAVIFAVALLIGYRGIQLRLLFWIGLNQFLNAFLLYVRSNISALLMFKTDSVLSVTDKLLMILFCGLLLWGNITDEPFRIEWFVWCQTVAYLITIAVALFIVLRKANLHRLTWNWPFFVVIIKKSLPYALVTFLMACYYRIDSVMLVDSTGAQLPGAVIKPPHASIMGMGIVTAGKGRWKHYEVPSDSTAVKFDYAIITKGFHSSVARLKELVDCDSVILSGGIYSDDLHTLQQECATTHFPHYNIKTTGAFVKME